MIKMVNRMKLISLCLMVALVGPTSLAAYGAQNPPIIQWDVGNEGDPLPPPHDPNTYAIPPGNALGRVQQVSTPFALACNPVEAGGDVEESRKAVVIYLDDELFFPIPIIKYVSPWLPQDPGAAGDTTIAGVDADNDCVRDDIEHYIVSLYPKHSDSRNRKYLFEYAKWLGAQLESNIDEETAKTISRELSSAGRCVTQILENDAREALDNVFAHFHNTDARSLRYIGGLSNLAGWTTREAISVVSCP